MKMHDACFQPKQTKNMIKSLITTISFNWFQSICFFQPVLHPVSTAATNLCLPPVLITEISFPDIFQQQNYPSGRASTQFTRYLHLIFPKKLKYFALISIIAFPIFTYYIHIDRMAEHFQTHQTIQNSNYVQLIIMMNVSIARHPKACE